MSDIKWESKSNIIKIDSMKNKSEPRTLLLGFVVLCVIIQVCNPNLRAYLKRFISTANEVTLKEE